MTNQKSKLSFVAQVALSQLAPRIADELQLPARAVEAVLSLVEEGATVPFIARYRKERTQGMDEVQIRAIVERHQYLVELEERRATVLNAIDEQGQLTAALQKLLLACATKTELEDLYLPYKKKRRTKAMIARERGLQPLADLLLSQGHEDPQQAARRFVDASREVPDVEAALAGARDIVVEQMSERPDIRAATRKVFAERGVLTVGQAKKTAERTRFEDYYDYQEPVTKLPTHRFLAIRRGESEGVLKAKIAVDEPHMVASLERMVGVRAQSPAAAELRAAVGHAFKRRLSVGVENDVRTEMKLRADGEAVEVFAQNLRHLLMAAPFGARTTIGIDPGLRTGCKCVALTETGAFVENTTIYPFRGAGDEARAKEALARFVERHKPRAIAIGNGTGGRETEKLVKAVVQTLDEAVRPLVVSVSEAGASVYSASDVAREEFPDLDLTVRGAISIARRLQDPLAELVKIDPKSIGVGQYQHDVSQTLLKRKLDEVVESCVNQVGVELNTASAPLLAHVAGLSARIAQNVVAHRDAHGPFKNRRALLKVSGLGPKAFEQAAGFIRVAESNHPLDRSGVHPERYALVEQMAKDLGVTTAALVGSAELAARIDIRRYVSEAVGEPTLRDIIEELKKPGRDPREAFEAPAFRDDVNALEDLREGMVLEGVVTNVTDFGAFVDVGVHQDGLVHISQLADRFVKHPSDVVKVGDKLKVRVSGVDLSRGRISLSARADGGGARSPSGPEAARASSEGRSRGGSREREGDRGRHGQRAHDVGGRAGEREQRGKSQSGFSNNPFARAADKLRRPS